MQTRRALFPLRSSQFRERFGNAPNQNGSGTLPSSTDDTHASSQRRSGSSLTARLKRIAETRLNLVSEQRLRDPGPSEPAQAAIRALAMAVPMQGQAARGLLLCRVLGRHKMLVLADDLSHAPHLLLDGFWAWWITAFIMRNLHCGQRFVDAGAGYGYFTLLAGELVGPAGRVLAVEANPLLADLTRRNIELNGMADRATVVSGAVGVPAAADMPMPRLAVPLDSPAAGRLIPDQAPEPDPSHTLVVPVRPALTLDAMLAAGADLVKLSLNGAEPAAWDGMQELLERRDGMGLIVSFDPARLDGAAEWLGRMAARFPLRRIEHDGIARAIRPEEVPLRGETTLYLSRIAPL